MIVVVVSQANMMTNSKNLVVDYGTTRHICANKYAFTSYTLVGDNEKFVYLGDSHTAQFFRKGKVMLKLTSRKTLTLNEMLHVPNIRANLVSIALLGKVRVKVSFESNRIVMIKVSFESNRIVMTKKNVFVGKGFCNQWLFVLGIVEILNEIISSSTYSIESYDIWHARL